MWQVLIRNVHQPEQPDLVGFIIVFNI